uniref:(northern house mosquito) hypothetical protein n=1 Tax=Culex pipiens TaxID=7175 RepID=A0A8D8B9H5_CULPI
MPDPSDVGELLLLLFELLLLFVLLLLLFRFVVLSNPCLLVGVLLLSAALAASIDDSMILSGSLASCACFTCLPNSSLSILLAGPYPLGPNSPPKCCWLWLKIAPYRPPLIKDGLELKFGIEE